MKIIKTKFKDLIIYNKETYRDKRGYFRELFLDKKIKEKFPFDVMSLSKKNVLRGLHMQLKQTQAKYVTVLKGKIFDVCVDLRKNSKTFGKYFSLYLSEEDNNSLLIPKGFAHGFCALTKDVILHYKCSNYRNPNYEKTLIWNDTNLKIKWPIKNPILSKKDTKGLNISAFRK